MRVAVASVLALISAPAVAGGFYLQEQSPTAVGRAFAGEAAIADGPATIWFNPAGMTNLPGNQIDLGTHLLDIHSHQRDTGTTRTYPGVPGAFPVGGGDGGNPFGKVIIVPSGYASFHLAGTNLWAGVGVSSPFNIRVDYQPGWFGRYDSLNSKLTSFNIQPSLAWRINDHVSVGGGIDFQKLSADLTSALPNLGPGLPDGALRISGQDSKLGWNAGVLVTYPGFRVGGHYRSHINHNLSGLAEISGLLGPLSGQNGSFRGFAPISTPDIATVSGVIGKRARLLGSLTWYNWSRFQRIAILNDAGQPFLDSEQHYRDTWSYAAAGEYDVSPVLTVRGGAMYDQTPTIDGYRTTRVPDGDRIWASAGATAKLTDFLSLNLSYAHVFVKTANVNRVDPLFAGTPAVTTIATNSVNTGSVDQLASSLTFKF